MTRKQYTCVAKYYCECRRQNRTVCKSPKIIMARDLKRYLKVSRENRSELFRNRTISPVAVIRGEDDRRIVYHPSPLPPPSDR